MSKPALNPEPLYSALQRPFLSTAQVVSLHCNLDGNTMHLMNKERLELMKKDAILVNAARGPIVDEVALVNHLKANPEFRFVASYDLQSCPHARFVQAHHRC